MADVPTPARDLADDKHAMTSIEYAILAGGLVLAIAGVVSNMGSMLNNKLLNIISAIS